MENNTSSTNIIELKHITKTFEDGFVAVEDFNLTVKRGEFVTQYFNGMHCFHI